MVYLRNYSTINQHSYYLTCYAIVVYSVKGFGSGTGRILLDNVECSGDEARLQNCQFGRIGQHNCDHTKDAGVVCMSSGIPS